jgi:hypothetical protein
MNVALLVEPHQVQDALTSIRGISEVGLPEGSALHVFVADENTASHFSNPAEGPYTLHVFDNPDEVARYPRTENLLFMFCMMTFADSLEPTLVLEPGTYPSESTDIEALIAEFNQVGVPSLAYPGDDKGAPRFGVFGAGFWHYSTGTRFLYGRGTPTYTEKITYDCGPPYRTSEVLGRFNHPVHLDYEQDCPSSTPVAVVTPAKKGVKKVRMKTRSRVAVA